MGIMRNLNWRWCLWPVWAARHLLFLHFNQKGFLMFKPQGWQRSTRLLAVSSVLLLAACGGGGGGDSSGGGSVTYYTVTVSTTGNGSVSPSDPQSVASNGSVTFTATPDAGWKA